MKNYIRPGEVIDHVASGAKSAGQVVLMGTKIGVCVADIANGATGPVQVIGVFNIAKLSTDVVAQGAALYWDNTNSRLTTTSAGNTLAGYATDAAGNGVATVNIKINA